MHFNAKRARLQEDRDEVVRATDAKRLLATAERDAQEAKRKAIAEAADSLKAKKKSDLAAAAAKTHSNWLQTVAVAEHAADMIASVKAMSSEATTQAVKTMNSLQRDGRFKSWIVITDPWKPDLTLLHLFGSLPNTGDKFSTAAKRQVRCSPQLAAFIHGHTGYADPPAGPDPVAALQCLLKSCFVRSPYMFKDSFSAFQLLSSSQLILDMAFVRAVLAASAWLGPHATAAGHKHAWQPLEVDAGL